MHRSLPKTFYPRRVKIAQLYLIHLRLVCNMVVVHAQASTSATSQKKNRRKLHKKAARSSDRDAEMREGGPQLEAIEHGAQDNDDEVMIDTEDAPAPADGAAPVFAPLSAEAQRSTLKSEIRRVPIPPHRMTPLKKDWVDIFGPLTEMLGLQVRMNVQRRSVEIRVSPPCLSAGF